MSFHEKSSNENKLHNYTADKYQSIAPYSLFDGAFDEESIEKICQIMDKQTLSQGPVGRDKNKELSEKFSEANTGLRRASHVVFLNRQPEVGWIFDRFNFAINELNDRYYNFDLYGYDVFQYSEYRSEDSGCYDFHVDMSLNRSPKSAFRKLSVVMLLNEPQVDFEGGEFEIHTGQEVLATKVALKKGRVLIMPSFIAHRVKKVTKGVRKSTVLWVTGPKFR